MICLCCRNFAKQKRDRYVKRRICPYGILSKKQTPTGLSFFHRDTPQGVTRYMQGKNMFYVILSKLKNMFSCPHV